MEICQNSLKTLYILDTMANITQPYTAIVTGLVCVCVCVLCACFLGVSHAHHTLKRNFIELETRFDSSFFDIFCSYLSFNSSLSNEIFMLCILCLLMPELERRQRKGDESLDSHCFGLSVQFFHRRLFFPLAKALKMKRKIFFAIFPTFFFIPVNIYPYY